MTFPRTPGNCSLSHFVQNIVFLAAVQWSG